MEVSIQCVEIAVRESGVEPFQPRTVLELAFRDGDADGDGDPLVQRREVPQAAGCLDRPVDDGPECIDDLGDRVRGGYWWRGWRCLARRHSSLVGLELGAG